ncbi:thiamine ABC transporter ATP-binding protein [Ignatzschineria sp. F8392]|nr:thiamine ABC transporter ATP-binding protein [Ignatzschineria sp. F8392]
MIQLNNIHYYLRRAKGDRKEDKSHHKIAHSSHSDDSAHAPLQMRFDFTITQGERVAIMGPSGAGKSTLLNLISGFQYPESGKIYLNGENFTTAPPAKRPVSMLFQENNLFNHLTVRQNIGLGIAPTLRLKAEEQKTVAAIAEQVGLTEFLDRLPGQLSGGQRQRVALARCFIREQPILLLDEPFSALDPALRHEMLLLLEERCRARDITLLMVSHNIEDAHQIAPRTLVIDRGGIAYDGATEKLLSGEDPAALLLGITQPPNNS